MNIARRRLAGLVPVAALLIGSAAQAASADETAVLKLLMEHRDALKTADAKALDRLSAPELSYSHSDGHIEDKATFIANATSGRSQFLSLSYESPTVRIVGTAAITRFNFVAELKTGDKVSPIKLGILMVWQKQGGVWKVLARCSTKL